MAVPYAWGIDIGNRALKAIRLSTGPAGLQIDDFDLVEHEQILSNAGDNRESMIQSALALFAQRHDDLKKTPVAIGVSGQSSFARFIKLPPVEPRKIPEIVRFEAIQQIPFPLDEVEWSYQLFTDPQSPDVEVGIFAMRKDLVNQHIGYFSAAGLNVQTVQMNPLAVYNAMYYDERIKGTTMIVDVGAENTDLIIAEGETIWLRSIPIGGNKFTEALAAQFKLKFPKAEELKRNAATSKYGRQILQAMKPVFNELVSEIQRSIGFYASNHQNSRINRVIALGGTFRLPGLQKYVQQNLQIEVQRLDHMSAGAPSDPKVGTLFNENILSAVGPYGLALQALGAAKINSSLLPMAIRRERMWREKTPWFGAAAAVFVAAPLLAYGSIYMNTRMMQANALADGASKAVLTQGTQLSQEWDTQVESAGQPDRNRASNYLSLRNGRGVQNTLIGDITSALPPATVITDVNKTKLPPREKRPDIRIDRIAMDYHSDMSPIMAMDRESFRQQATVGGIQVPQNPATIIRPGATGPGVGSGFSQAYRGGFGGGGGSPMLMPNPGQANNAAGADQAAAKTRGFVIEIICTTPNAGGASYVLSTLVPKLQALKPSDLDVNYRVDKVEAPRSLQLKDDPNVARLGTGASGTSGFGAGGYSANGFGGHGGGFAPSPSIYSTTPGATTGAPGTSTEPPYDPLKDPVTGEDMSNDTQVTIRMSVLLDPPPPTAEGTGAGETGTPGAPAVPATPVPPPPPPIMPRGGMGH